MTEYDTDVNTLSLSADFQATDKLALSAAALYSRAQADWKGLNISTPAAITDQAVNSIYDIDDVNVITGYSDLEYEQAELSLGGNYALTPSLYLAATAAWQMFADESPYVYGDQDGSAYRGSFGVGYRF